MSAEVATPFLGEEEMNNLNASDKKVLKLAKFFFHINL
jgi:hypothetical protein